MESHLQRPGALPAARRALGALARAVVVGVLAGGLAGVIAGGVGGRIAMRISALAAGDAQQGAITEADATVGEITAGGTAGLIIFGGMLVGILGGLFYVALRSWLADAGRWRGLVFGLLLLAVFGWAVVEGDNPDFHRFGPSALNIAMFGSIFVLFGVLVAPLFDWIEQSLPRPAFGLRLGPLALPNDLSPSGVGSLGAHAFGVLFALGILSVVANAFDEEGDNKAFFGLVPGYVLLVPPVAALLLTRAAGRFRRLSDLRPYPAAMALAVAVLALPVVLGLVLDVRAVVDILHARG